MKVAEPSRARLSKLNRGTQARQLDFFAFLVAAAFGFALAFAGLTGTRGKSHNIRETSGRPAGLMAGAAAAARCRRGNTRRRGG